MNVKYHSLFLLIFGILCSCTEPIDPEEEKKAIIAVIEEETNAFRDRDFERFSKTYLNDETVIRMGIGKYGYAYDEGWETIGQNYKIFFSEYPERGEEPYKKSNYRIKLHKESAWVVFDEDGDVGVRFMEKVSGEWKIAYLGIIWAKSYQEEE